MKKALSAVRLTPRFSEIISTAKADKIDVHVHQDWNDNMALWEELKAATIRAAAQHLKKKEAELRQKEREAALFALQMMESTVDFEDNLMILRNLSN